MTAPRRTRPILLVGIALCVAVAVRARLPDGGDAGGLEGLARLGASRPFAARLSISTQHRPCPERTPPDGTVPRADCGPPRVDPARAGESAELAVRISAAARERPTMETLHAAAVADLLWADAEGRSLRRAVASLEEAARMEEPSAGLLTDLAAAYLLRAEREQTPEDLLRAVDAADEAVAVDAGHAGARFDLALALDRLGLETQAVAAWNAYLAVDSTSAWASEARARLAQRPDSASAAPPADASDAELEAFAARSPRAARLLGWDVLLGEWGAAALAGDAGAAAQSLRRAGTLGDALERGGGDATLADEVRLLRDLGDGPTRRRFARAHRAYAAGRAAYEATRYDDATAPFAEAAATAPAGTPLAGWARLARASAGVLGGRRGRIEATQVLRGLAAGVDTVRHPALAGGAHAALGTALLRDGRPQQALERYGRALALHVRAGETESAVAARSLMAEAQFGLGVAPAAHASMHDALVRLRPYRRSVWLHNVLAVWAEAAAADGFARAAVRMQEEGVRVAEARGIDTHLTEALLGRARLRAAVGDTAGAWEDVGAARPMVDRMDDSAAWRWFAADAGLTRAALASRSDPRRAIAVLESAVPLAVEAENGPGVLNGRTTGAEARLAVGDVAGAIRELDHAAVRFHDKQAWVTNAAYRNAFLDGARRVFDRLVMVQTSERQVGAALESLERGRASLAPTSGRSAAIPGGWHVPAGSVAVEYALIGDTLLAWTVSGDDVRLVRTHVRRAVLDRIVERVRAALERGRDDDALRRDLSVLYDVLIRPHEARLGGTGTELVVVADGEVAAVPFAALYDARRGRFLVEERPVRFAGSLRDVAPFDASEGTSDGPALFVADPAFDRAEHPRLEPLPGAAGEVAAVAGAYAGSTTLAGERASRAALRDALPRAGLLHFAGHAVFDDERPERSYLVLAGGSPTTGTDRLTAADVQEMELDGLRLVVLSACETVRSRETRSGGFAGFAGALLAAGAGGVVGTTWKVDDEWTRALMTEFHRAYRSSSDASAALRTAQLRLLRSGDASLRSPSAWAGFRYAGR